jgi:hypothetical protein
MTAMTAAEDPNSAGVSQHVYPAGAMVGDYLRSAAGLVPTIALFATVPIGVVPGVILVGFGAVFAVFGARTVMRHRTRIEMTDTGLRALGMRARVIGWAELDRFRLAYYSVRRDKRSGWMQLELGAGATKLSLDSRIDGFDQVVRRAAEIAAARGIELNEATVANLEALGIRPLPAGEGL